MEKKICSVPFCHSTCSGKDHHPLVKTLCDFPCNGSAPYQSYQSKLEDAITDAQANGWGMSDDVPEKGTNCPKLPLMHWAAVLGKGHALKRLVEEGFSTKCINPGITALSLAMRHMLVSYAKCNEISQSAAGFKSLAEVLFRFDKDIEDSQGRIALNLACEQYVTALTQPGAECSFRKSVLHTLLSLIDTSAADGVALLNHGDCERNTCLHVLAQRDECMDFVDTLLAKGADPTIRNKHGKTPCEVAQSFGQHQLARRLFRATPMSVTGMKRPGSPDLVRDVPPHSALPASAQTAMPIMSDMSQQVREQVKHHVTSRHAQAAATPVIQIMDNTRAGRSGYQAQMKGTVRELRDVCSVDFAVMNQQSVPFELVSRHPHVVPNGVSAGQISGQPSHSSSMNGDYRGDIQATFSNYGQLSGSCSATTAAAAHRQEVSSPPPLLPGPVCNGSSTSRVGISRHRAAVSVIMDDQIASDSSLSSEESEDEHDLLLEDELLFAEEDGFIVTLKHIKGTLGEEAMTTIVAAEADRREADYNAALNQEQEAKQAYAQLIAQSRAAKKRCDTIVAKMEELKTQLVFVNEELEQRNRRCADLDHERQAIDSQYRLAQLQHMSCSQALEAIPLAFQMNIAFDDDTSASESYPETTSSHADTSTPFFDNASVSSTPVYQAAALV
eukprot:scpid40046/ scgid21769/ 